VFSKKASGLIKKITSDKEHIRLTVGIFHNGETVCKLFNSAGEIPYESHLYEMGSVGKVFVKSLLAKYLHEGKMNLDDSVAKYMPELSDEKYYPTLKR
jgi:CubicO group peptidase (beta-lactamase class C family)